MPDYITSLYKSKKSITTALRSRHDEDFAIPRPHLELFKESMSSSGPMIWNKIPTDIRTSATLNAFSSNFIKWMKDSTIM